MNISRIQCFGDSKLVSQQVTGTWDSKDPLMAAYRREVSRQAGFFTAHELITYIAGKMRQLMIPCPNSALSESRSCQTSSLMSLRGVPSPQNRISQYQILSRP